MATAFQQIPVVTLFNASTPLSSLTNHLVSTDIRIPAKKTTTKSGLPVLALYKEELVNLSIYMLVTREPQGYIFDHYYYETDMVEVMDEEFSLSQMERKEVEKFLSNGHDLDK